MKVEHAAIALAGLVALKLLDAGVATELRLARVGRGGQLALVAVAGVIAHRALRARTR